MALLEEVLKNHYKDGWETQDRWIHTEIDPSNWNKEFPYQLLIVKKAKDGYNTLRTFTLPIPPRSMSIQLPFAVLNNITLDGITEEHAGAPVRFISFDGTTGVAPFRRTNARAPESSLAALNTATGGVFGGTIEATQNLVNAVSNAFGKYASNAHNASESGLTKDVNNQDGIPEMSTGYAQFHLLREFLEGYAAMKLNKDNRDVRLALAIWKDSAVYLVTPISFDLRRDANSPYEYQYSLRFKAWSRIRLKGNGPSEVAYTPPALDESVMGTIYRAFDGARLVIGQGLGLIEAAIGDSIRVANLMREAGAIVKNAAKIVITLRDLPDTIREQFVNAYEDMLRQIEEGISGLQSGADLTPIVDAISTRGATLSREEIEDLLEEMPLSTLSFGPLGQAAIRYVEELNQNRRDKLINVRNELKRTADDFAWKIGASDDIYEQIYGRKGRGSASDRTPTPDEMQVLWALQAAIAAIEEMAASDQIDRKDIPTSLEYVAGLAAESGIDFEIPQSKIAIPVPYGFTLEQIAQRYLGDPNRWMEIAALNKLRAPYIDEEGFSKPLVLNGSGNHVFVEDDTNLYQGQVVWLYSATQIKEKRRITGIRKISSGNYQISLDGAPDLDRFLVIDNAALHTFLPNTVNSQMVFFIPSSEEAPQDYGASLPSEVNDFDHLLDLGGIDLLLTENNDLVIGADGGGKLTFGLQNIIQNARIRLSTERGTLLHHDDFGIDVSVGGSTADSDANAILKSVQEAFQGDPAIARVSAVTVRKEGPTVHIGLSLELAGSGKTVPLSFQLTQ